MPLPKINSQLTLRIGLGALLTLTFLLIYWGSHLSIGTFLMIITALLIATGLFYVPYWLDRKTQSQSNTTIDHSEWNDLKGRIHKLQRNLQNIIDEPNTELVNRIATLESKSEAVEKVKEVHQENITLLKTIENRLALIDKSIATIPKLTEDNKTLQKQFQDLEFQIKKIKVASSETSKITPAKKEKTALLNKALSNTQDTKASPAVDRIIRAKQEAPTHSKPEPKIIPKTSSKPQEQSKESLPENPATELFPDTDETEKTTSNTISNTKVIAEVLIGIGNKPYIRGEGRGLSWEQGTPMQFLEIGKWQWSPNQDPKAPILFQIYRNDKDPDTNGQQNLPPEQALTIKPQF